MQAASLFLFAVSTATLTTESPLRSGCDEDEALVAKLPAGATVEVRSALNGGSGACYKVIATVDGKSVTGYVNARALAGADSFDQARRGARDMGASSSGGGASADAKAAIQAATSKAPREHPASKARELIEQNQPAEALRLIEPGLQRYPMDAYLHAVAGLAFYRMDNLERALFHWRTANEIEPSKYIESMIARIGREKGADKGSERMVGSRVVVRYERSTVEEPLARAMLDVLDEEYSRISFQLGCRASEKVTAVVQSRDSYLQSTNAAEWSGGLYDGRIHVPVADSRQVGARTRETFAHELIHACLHELGRWPSWLHEGLAQKFSGRLLAPASRAQIESMIKAGQLPKLSQLGQNWSGLSAGHARLAYVYAQFAAEKLIEMTANTGLANLLRNPGDMARVTAELERKLGL